MTRKDPTDAQKTRLLQQNADVCCVCKNRGLGVHLHHIDGNSANTIDENLAVLCVRDHDLHHRPSSYSKPNHLDLTKDQIKAKKNSWEAFVREASKPHPHILAVISVYGSEDRIHSMRLVFQWQDSKIELERTYHLLSGPPDSWIESIFDEVKWLGEHIPISLIDEPQSIEYCPCCNQGLSTVLDPGPAKRLTSEDWGTKSLATIYINPHSPSMAIAVFLDREQVFSGHLHLCQGTHLHFLSDKYDERVRVKQSPSVRTQACDMMLQVIEAWKPATILLGTGDPDKPNLIDDLILPRIWEKRKPG